MSLKYSRTSDSTLTPGPTGRTTGADASTTTSTLPMCPYALSGTSTTAAVEAERNASNTVDIISQWS